MHSSGDTEMARFVSGGELAWFLICTLLLIQAVACLASEGVLAWILMCILLLRQTVACLVSAGE